MKDYKAKDVEDYIEHSAPEARPVLEALRSIIKSTVPEAEESISWGVPFYRYKGALAGFATYKNHVAFGCAAALPAEHREALEEKGYKTGSKTVQIKFTQKVPVTGIKQILKAQVKMNEAIIAVKKSRVSSGCSDFNTSTSIK